VSKAVSADAGIAPSLLETPWAPHPEDRVGHFGCSAGGGRVVRLALRGRDGHKPPRTLLVDCPACGVNHRVAPSWRRSHGGEEGRPELVVDAEAIDGPDAPSIEEVA
jgi:acetyl esterase/lipase